MNPVSVTFIFFLAFVAASLRILPGAWKRAVLIAASFVFIASFNVYSPLALILSAALTFFIGKKRSGAWFIAGILFNSLAILLSNYLLIRGTDGFVHLPLSPGGKVLLLAGLSFYNLQHVAYLVDVRAGSLPAEKDFSMFILSSSFFPKLLSGPLMLYQEIAPQLAEPRAGREEILRGCNRILLGLFKKMCIADRLAAGVASVFDYRDDLPGLTVLTGAVLFTIQLYFDFSGYSDIAIGAASILGVRLKENFTFPLRAPSVTVFWRRWHESLMTFFRIYVFLPASFRFRRLGKHAALPALAATFFISGIWHGLSMVFLSWAACHFIYLTAEYYLRRPGKAGQVTAVAGAAMVWLLVSLSNVFFRSEGLEQAFYLYARLAEFYPTEWLADFIAPLATGGHQADRFNFYITLAILALTLVYERRIFSVFNSDRFRAIPAVTMVMLILLTGVFGSTQRFIYMQF